MKNKIIILFIVILSVVLLLLVIAALPVNPMVDPTEYTTCSAGILSPVEQRVFEEILAAAEAGQPTVKHGPEVSTRKILTHFGLYYGTMENVWCLLPEADGVYYLNLEAFEKFERNRIAVDAAVDEALRHIKEGPPRYKLRQIARFLANRITYTDGIRETVDGLRGKGVCATYSMLFYKMASRLGIETYICYGYTIGGYHSWNMVVLNDKEYYYDITWYDDVILNPIYLHSRNSWGRDYMLNNLWASNEMKETEE